MRDQWLIHLQPDRGRCQHILIIVRTNVLVCFDHGHDRPLLAGQRPSGSAVATSLAGLHLSLLGDLQRVVNLDPEVSDRAFELL